MNIVIHGQTPAQKNGKSVGTVKATGRTFVASSKTVKTWQKAALEELDKLDLKFRPASGRLKIDYMFYVKDNVQRDADNMVASINDILQQGCADKQMMLKKNGKWKMERVKKTGIIVGDHWQVLKLGDIDVAIDKENPRAVLTISEL